MSDATPTVEKPAEDAPPAPAGKSSALPEDEIARLTYKPPLGAFRC